MPRTAICCTSSCPRCPTTRTDGVRRGRRTGRGRFALEVVDAVRAAVGESVPLLVRVSATDWVEDGLQRRTPS